jgi:hypothetical protein
VSGSEANWSTRPLASAKWRTHICCDIVSREVISLCQVFFSRWQINIGWLHSACKDGEAYAERLQGKIRC